VRDQSNPLAMMPGHVRSGSMGSLLPGHRRSLSAPSAPPFLSSISSTRGVTLLPVRPLPSVEDTEAVTCCLRGGGATGIVMRGNVVQSVVAGSEPACAGIRKGDRIIRVDNEQVEDGTWFCLEAIIGDATETTLELRREVLASQRFNSAPFDIAAPTSAQAETATKPMAEANEAKEAKPEAAVALAVATARNGSRAHIRRASAPAGLGSRNATSQSKASSGATSPRTVLGDVKEPLSALRSWWAGRKVEKQQASTVLPTMPFLEEAFDENSRDTYDD